MGMKITQIVLYVMQKHMLTHETSTKKKRKEIAPLQKVVYAIMCIESRKEKKKKMYSRTMNIPVYSAGNRSWDHYVPKRRYPK